MRKNLKCDFFEVQPKRNGVMPLKDALQSLINLGSNQRTFEEFDLVCRMDSLTGTNHRIHGDLVRIRMTDLPERCNKRGRKIPLQLEDDEGLGESNAFMLDSDRNILAIQKNKFGISPNSFVRYIHDKTNGNGDYVFFPILSQNGMIKLRDLTTVRKIEVQFGKVDSAHVVSPNHSFGQATKILNQFEGAYINLTLSMSHNQGTMNKGKLMRSVRELFSRGRSNDASIEKFKIDGYDTDGKDEIIDLLADKISYKSTIEVAERKAIPYTKRKRFIEEAFEDRGEEIRRVQRL